MSQYALYPSAVVACLRAAMWHEPLSIDPALLREVGFWQEAYRQDCGHLLSVWALAQGYDVYDKESMRLWVYAALQRQARQNRFLTELVTLFREHNIPAVLLKGYGICTYYPDPAMRIFGDIDLHVGCAHYQEAYSLVAQSYPHAYWLSPSGVGHHFILVMDEKRELVAEIHNLPMDFFGQPKVERIFSDYTERSFSGTDTLTLYDIVVSVPPISYNVVYLFVHLWNHFLTSGVGLRQLCDWALCLHALSKQLSSAEWKQFEQQTRSLLQSMHLLPVWQSFGYVVVKYLGLSPCAFPLYSNAFPLNSGDIPLKSVSRYTSCKYRYRVWQSERLYRQLLADGHSGRSTAPRSAQIMHAWPAQIKPSSSAQNMHTCSEQNTHACSEQNMHTCSEPNMHACSKQGISSVFKKTIGLSLRHSPKNTPNSRTTPEGTPNQTHPNSRFSLHYWHTKSRLSHRLCSFFRLTYNAIQLAKLFPVYSVCRYCAQLFAAIRHKK